ncbi:MAG: glycosyltransferase family 39 protein [bacterium]|nr:glycosyltransferase family 39 protein [bacterium]
MTNFLAKLANFTTKNRFILVLLVITFFVRLPSLFEPFWYGDEAIYAVIGQKILRGGLLYVDIFDHKTPGIYYLTALSLKVFGQTIWSLRFVLMGFSLASLVVFFQVGKKLFDERVAKLASIILAALIATPLIEGNIFNSEILMILPLSLGVLLGLNKRYFWSGFFFSLGFLLKFPAVFDFGAFFVFLALATTRKTFLENLKSLFLLTLGYSLPIVLTVVYFALQNALGDYLFSALLFNFSYTNYGNQLVLAGRTIPNGLIMLKGLPLLSLVIYFLWKLYQPLVKGKETKNPVSSLEFVIIWLGFAFYGAVFGGRAYPHYLIQATPAFALLLGAGLGMAAFKKITFMIAALVVSLALLLGFRSWTTTTYYSTFFRFVTNQITEETYMNSFDKKTARNYSIASFLDGCVVFSGEKCLKTRTSQTDSIYIWGNSPVIYFLSQRDPSAKYITAFHVTGNNVFKKEVLSSIRERLPVYILRESSAPDFPELDNILTKQYNFFAQTDDIKIYQRFGGLEAD